MAQSGTFLVNPQNYEIFFKREKGISYNKFEIPYLFLPARNIERYESDKFQFFIKENDQMVVNNVELELDTFYKLAVLQEPILIIPKIYYYLRPVTAIQMGVLYVTSQLFGIRDTNQIKMFLQSHPKFINNFQSYFELVYDFSKNARFTVRSEIVTDQFENDTYLSYIQYLAHSMKENTYIPKCLNQILFFDLDMIGQDFEIYKTDGMNKDIIDYFSGICPTPNFTSSFLGYCPLCDNFVHIPLFQHWKEKKNSIHFCEAKCSTVDNRFKCIQCGYIAANREDIFVHYNTFCTKNFLYCKICQGEGSSCKCTRTRTEHITSLQNILDKLSQSNNSAFHPDNLHYLNNFLENNRIKLLHSRSLADKNSPGRLEESRIQAPIIGVMSQNLEQCLDIKISGHGDPIDTEIKYRHFRPGSDNHNRDSGRERFPVVGGSPPLARGGYNATPSGQSQVGEDLFEGVKGSQRQHICFCGTQLTLNTIKCLRSHLQDHMLQFSCTRCSHMGYTLDDLLSHLKTHDYEEVPRTPCDTGVTAECWGEGMTTLVKEAVHQLIHHTPDEDAYIKWLGDLEDIQIDRRSSTVTGTRTRQTDTKEPKYKTKQLLEVKDDRSGWHKSSYEAVTSVERQQSQGRPQIDLDTWSMSDDDNYEIGAEQKKEGGKKYPCESEKCKKQGVIFDQKEQLEVHIQERHACTECNYANMYDSQLLAHILTHRNKDKEYQCSYCKAKFTSKIALNNHHQGQHSLECNICKERNFATQEILMLHKETCDRAAMEDSGVRDSDPVIQMANILWVSNPEQRDKISSLIATQIRNNERLLNPKKFLTKRGLYLELPSFSPTPGRAVPSHRLKNLPEFNPTLGRDKDNLRNHLQLTKVIASLRQLVSEFALDESTAVSIFLQTCSEEAINTLNALSVVDVTSMSLENILHTLRDVFYSIDIEDVYLKSSNIHRLANEDLRTYYIRMMNMVKLASYNLNPSQRLEWIDAQSRSQFLKHVPSEFAHNTREEEIKRGKRYTGPEIFTNYLEYVKATKKKNDLGIHNLREGSSRPQRNPRYRERSRDRCQTSSRIQEGRTNNIQRGNTFRGRGRQQHQRGYQRKTRGDSQQVGRFSGNRGGDSANGYEDNNRDGPNTYNNGGTRGNTRRGARRPTKGDALGPPSRLFTEAIRKSLNLAPEEIACYLCGKRNSHISRNCDLYPGIKVQEQKCQSCLRFYHPTNHCKSRLRGINNKEE